MAGNQAGVRLVKIQTGNQQPRIHAVTRRAGSLTLPDRVLLDFDEDNDQGEQREGLDECET